MKKLPIGIQSFSKMIEGGFVYLDKTEMIYRLANTEACYFLSRPRRFGKSLTLSTFHEYFNGRKDLFVGTKMEQLEQKWDVYPVLHFDFNNATYESLKNLREELGSQLEDMEAIYNITAKGSLPSRFKRLINAAASQTGKKVVILVDEYDKPLLNNILNDNLKDKMRKEMKPFYGVLKTCDTQIKMAFVTGVTKFSKVSLFSDVNNMTDISNMLDYSTICGATEREIHENLDGFVQNMADANHIAKDQCYNELKRWYEGFHFCEDSEDVYNPFGLMKALLEKKFKEYWFESGTPTFLVQVIKKRGMKISDLDCVKRTASQLGKIDNFNDDPVPLLFQSGYLTIKGYDPVLKRYTLTMPNKEIAEAFPTFILNYYFPKTDGGDFDITNFIEEVLNGDIDGFMKRLVAFFADSSNMIIGEAEKYFQNTFYLIFKLLGFYSEVERSTSDGRMDAVVKTPQNIFVFEFKVDKPAQEALDQINSKEYALPFIADGRKVCKVGVSFSSETKKIAEWNIEN